MADPASPEPGTEAPPASGGQHPGEVLGLGIIPAVVLILHILAEQHRQFGSLGHITGPATPACGKGVQQAGGIVSLIIVHAITGHHEHGSPFNNGGGDRQHTIAHEPQHGLLAYLQYRAAF